MADNLQGLIEAVTAPERTLRLLEDLVDAGLVRDVLNELIEPSDPHRKPPGLPILKPNEL